MDSLSIEVYQVALTLVGRDGLRREAEIFLHTTSAREPRPERISDRLNESNLHFLPFAIAGAIQLVCLDWIESLEVSSDLPELLEIEEIGAEKAAVVLHLAEDRRLEGELIFQAPPQQRRLSSALNAPGQSFLLLKQGDLMVFVNRNAVTRVELGS